jgi:hypothetical protein
MGLALFARATWLLGADKLRPFVSLALGVGYIRHVAEFKTAPEHCGPTKQGTCFDTVPAGPVLVGPGGGMVYNLTKTVGLVLGMNTQLGFPKFTFNVDLNAGLAFQF